MMDEISSIKNFFASYHIPLSIEWLQSCVNWCKEEILPSNYTVKDLQRQVYEQWLLLDLRDIELASLPLDLSNKVQYTLVGNYALQVMKVVDISKPKHWQLQRIRNGISQNTDEEKESSKRVLQLTLTDGVQEVEAMEYKTISCLNINLSPGLKILLSGPVTIRRGRIMLQPHNIKVLGGEVEDLIVPNAAENVLAQILKLPLNPTRKLLRKNRTKDIDFTEEEEMRIAEEVDMLMEIERDFETNRSRPGPSKTPDMFDDMDLNDDDFENIEMPAAVIKTSTETGQISTSTNRENELTVLTPQKPTVLTLEKLLKNIPNISNGRFKIRAKFKSIVEKLTILDDGYHLVVQVEDETADMVVKFHSDVIANLAECSPEVLLSLKAEVVEKNAEAQRKVLETIKRIKEKLLQLSNVVELQISVKETYPVVLKILD
ncbi:hypothetical protein NQ318_013704 [Aromia moschata]|uniref:RecQ-mediated genome instability protein 1 n=1 Tax=Aromia moschata TaxID=1265417 RepID=A0AAV8ZAM0_9CUCU|nr:hypothetical protein NQ318_013704 [Aromia moschata]